MKIRTYTEMLEHSDFEGRLAYLRLSSRVGRDTFGFDRYLNQRFYESLEWKTVRNEVIARDYGCDLAMRGHEIFDKVLVHHMNPITPDDLIHGNGDVLDPEFLITVSHQTHNAIHYGDAKTLTPLVVERRPGDTKLW